MFKFHLSSEVLEFREKRTVSLKRQCVKFVDIHFTQVSSAYKMLWVVCELITLKKTFNSHMVCKKYTGLVDKKSSFRKDLSTNQIKLKNDPH